MKKKNRQTRRKLVPDMKSAQNTGLEKYQRICVADIFEHQEKNQKKHEKLAN